MLKTLKDEKVIGCNCADVGVALMFKYVLVLKDDNIVSHMYLCSRIYKEGEGNIAAGTIPTPCEQCIHKFVCLMNPRAKLVFEQVQ